MKLKYKLSLTFLLVGFVLFLISFAMTFAYALIGLFLMFVGSYVAIHRPMTPEERARERAEREEEKKQLRMVRKIELEKLKARKSFEQVEGAKKDTVRSISRGYDPSFSTRYWNEVDRRLTPKKKQKRW